MQVQLVWPCLLAPPVGRWPYLLHCSLAPVTVNLSTGEGISEANPGGPGKSCIHCRLSMGLKCFIIPQAFLVSGPLAFCGHPSSPQLGPQDVVLGLLASPVLVQAEEVEAFPCDSLGSWSSLLRSSAGGLRRRTRILLPLPAAPRARAQHLPCWSLLSPVLQISTFLPASGRVGAPQLSTQPLGSSCSVPHDISQPGSLTGSVLLSLWADFYIHQGCQTQPCLSVTGVRVGILTLLLLEFSNSKGLQYFQVLLCPVFLF